MSSDGMHTGMDLGGLSPGAGEMGAAGMGMASPEECSRMVELRALLVQAAEDQVPRMIMNAMAWRASEQASRVLNVKGGSLLLLLLGGVLRVCGANQSCTLSSQRPLGDVYLSCPAQVGNRGKRRLFSGALLCVDPHTLRKR